MPRYVYGCTSDPAHPRQEVIHSMSETIRVICSKCGAEMRRVPQAIRFYRKPFDVLYEHMERTLHTRSK
jgi:predicted nucleic acid-binding Zn ribbon protein